MKKPSVICWVSAASVFLPPPSDDSALMKSFGQAGSVIFIGLAVIETEIERQYGVHCIGKTDEVMERFYAISVERKISHPAIDAIMALAREELFRN